MPKQSFGMKIELDTATEAMHLPFRIIPRMKDSAIKANTQISNLPGDVVTLSYVGSTYDPKLEKTTKYLWGIMKDGFHLQTRFETASCADDSTFISALVEGANEFSKRIKTAGLV